LDSKVTPQLNINLADKTSPQSSEPNSEQDKKESKEDPSPPPLFSGMKLKKSKPRQVKPPPEEPKIEFVQLKHHEFEKLPQTEGDELSSSVIMTEAFKDDKVKLGKKPKYKKAKPKEKQETSSIEKTTDDGTQIADSFQKDESTIRIQSESHETGTKIDQHQQATIMGTVEQSSQVRNDSNEREVSSSTSVTKTILKKRDKSEPSEQAGSSSPKKTVAFEFQDEEALQQSMNAMILEQKKKSQKTLEKSKVPGFKQTYIFFIHVNIIYRK